MSVFGTLSMFITDFRCLGLETFFLCLLINFLDKFENQKEFIFYIKMFVYLWKTAPQAWHVSVPMVKGNRTSDFSGHTSHTNPLKNISKIIKFFLEKIKQKDEETLKASFYKIYTWSYHVPSGNRQKSSLKKWSEINPKFWH